MSSIFYCIFINITIIWCKKTNSIKESVLVPDSMVESESLLEETNTSQTVNDRSLERE